MGGDPCFNVYKYLRVGYHCENGKIGFSYRNQFKIILIHQIPASLMLSVRR